VRADLRVATSFYFSTSIIIIIIINKTDVWLGFQNHLILNKISRVGGPNTYRKTTYVLYELLVTAWSAV